MLHHVTSYTVRPCRGERQHCEGWNKVWQNQRNNYLQSFKWIMPDHAACLQILSSPPQLPAAQVVPIAQPDFSTKLLVAGFPPFKVITPSWQLYLCQATQCCQLSAHWCFHGLKFKLDSAICRLVRKRSRNPFSVPKELLNTILG